MAAARITFRDNRQQQLKVEVTLPVRVYPSIPVCVQRHSGVPTKIIYLRLYMYKNETEATQQSQLAPSTHPPIRSPTPKPPASLDGSFLLLSAAGATL